MQQQKALLWIYDGPKRKIRCFFFLLQATTGNASDSCFLLKPSATFQEETCSLPTLKPIYDHVEEIEKHFHNPFWLPVKSSKYNFEWVEPSKYYAEEFGDFRKGEGANCLVYYNSSFIQARSCSDSFHSICVYDCYDNVMRQDVTSTLRLLKNSSQLFLAIEHEERLKILGRQPFKCFVDFNVSDARVLYKAETVFLGTFKNASLYEIPILSFVASNYWCEAFRNHDLKLIWSNKQFLSPCAMFTGNYSYSFVFKHKLQTVFSLSGENVCIQTITPQDDGQFLIQVTANETLAAQQRSSNELFCFSVHELLRMAQICVRLHSTTAITDQLIEILNSTCSPLQAFAILLTISENYAKFSPLDVYLAALIFRKFSNANINVSLATSIVHNIMEIERGILRESQHCYNATSMLLFRFDRILANAEMVNATEYVQTHQGSIMSLVANLKSANLSGVASYNHTTNMSVDVLSKTTPLEQLLDDANLHSAILLPEMFSENNNMANDVSDENTKLALTFYLKDSLFNVEDSASIKQVSSIFGTALKNFSGTLEKPIYVVFKSAETKNQSCAYWQLNKNSSEVMHGRWITADIDALYNYTGFVVCKYYRFAHFALLIFEDVYKTLDDDVIEILEGITIVNSALSLFGAFGIILTAILFKSWRKNKGNLVLMNFVLAICLQVISLHVSNYVNNQDTYSACAIVGAILHYSVLAEFCWMLVIAVLQYKRYVQVFASPPKQLMAKACVVGWVIPLIPVTALLIVQPHNYTKSLVGLCYPAEIALYLTIFAPIGAILIINIVFYVLIIIDIFSAGKRCVKKELIFQWLIVVLLFFMLGVTWAFAFLSLLFKSTILAFIFCVTSTLQGFVVFLFFIVFNKNTRSMYVKCLKNYFRKNDVISKINVSEKCNK